MRSRIHLTRKQILSFRRRVGGLDKRLPRGKRSLRKAAWAGLQDSMPRAAVLSIHARVEGTEHDAWSDPTFVQLWGPRFSVFVVAAADLAVFSLGRLPDSPKGRLRAVDTADRLDAFLQGAAMPFGEAGRAMGVPPNSLRYAAATGRVLLRWDGAHQPQVWTVPPPDVDPSAARLELARRYLHVYGPSTVDSFASWAGISRRLASSAFEGLRGELTPVTSPIGDSWILSSDETEIRTDHHGDASTRLLPSGDAYYLLQGRDRELLVPDEKRRNLLWTSRVWPGALLVDGEIVGIWRRSQGEVAVHPWQPLSPEERRAVVEQAASLPLPIDSSITVRWED
jgi:hypothetical protein